MQPGSERRARLRALKIKITTDDFSEAEWGEIEAEAPGTREALKSIGRNLSDE